MSDWNKESFDSDRCVKGYLSIEQRVMFIWLDIWNVSVLFLSWFWNTDNVSWNGVQVLANSLKV